MIAVFLLRDKLYYYLICHLLAAPFYLALYDCVRYVVYRQTWKFITFAFPQILWVC